MERAMCNIPMCNIPDCEIINYSKGLCRKHYVKALRAGTIPRIYTKEPMKIENHGDFGILGGYNRKGELIADIQVSISDLYKCSEFRWCINNGYPTTSINKKITVMHQFIIETTSMVDHIDRNPLNNRRENLRLCNRSQNKANSVSKTGIKGIRLVKNKYKARISKNGTVYHIGTFATISEAILAYNTKALELYREFAALNLL
jgi:hypothetical protein